MTNRILRSYIRHIVLLESYEKAFKDIDRIWEESEKDTSEFESLLVKNGYTMIGSGMTRRVYGKEGDDFLIKVRTNSLGSLIDANPNQGEIDINLGKSDNYIRDLTPRVYHSSEGGEWIIVEKVEVIKKGDDEVIKTLFPGTDRLRKILKKFFGRDPGLSACLNMIIKLRKKEESDDFSAADWKDSVVENLISNVEFYALRNHRLRLSDRHRDYIRKHIIIDKGITKLFTAMQTINSTDLRIDNLGYRAPLKPYDFVIIDFDYMNFNQDRKTKFLR